MKTTTPDQEHSARAIGRSLPVSTKACVETCRSLRHKKTAEAKKLLEQVIAKKKAIPFRRFHSGLSHKKEVGPGRYPLKSSLELLRLIESAEANAQFKGLATANLEITHIAAHQASRPFRFGRKRQRRAKRTTIEIIVAERRQQGNDTKEEKMKGPKKTAPSVQEKEKHD